jgi:molybdopterin-guanine dinucleotide biosynthesis protein A
MRASSFQGALKMGTLAGSENRSTSGLTVLILAGGRSQRMGQDKAWLPLGGRPLVERLARRVLPIASEIIFSTNQPEAFQALAGALPCPVQLAGDIFLQAGPLAGLHAGLSAARYDLVAALATDMPFVNPALLRAMAEAMGEHDAVVPQIPDQNGELDYEPMHAVYRRSCLPAMTAHLEAGHRRIVAFFPDVAIRIFSAQEVAAHDPHYRSFYNMNRPEDWTAAAEIVRAEEDELSTTQDT